MNKWNGPLKINKLLLYILNRKNTSFSQMLIKLRNNYFHTVYLINTSTIIPLYVFVIHVTSRFKLTLNGSPKLHTQKFIGNLKMLVHLVVGIGINANFDC